MPAPAGALETLLRMAAKPGLTRAAPRTPEFERWFRGSRVVDPQGNPLVMYHGTTGDFDQFSHAKQYSGEGATQTGSGFYFTDNPQSASRYTQLNGGQGGNVMPVYLSLKKPMHIDFSTGEATGAEHTFTPREVRDIILSAPNVRHPEDSPLLNWGDINREGFHKVLNDAVHGYAGGSTLAALRNDFFPESGSWLRALNKATGYDSAYALTGAGDRHFVAWFPEQIKSAIGNSGAFDPASGWITRAQGGAVRGPSLAQMRLALALNGCR